jgi:hypothetical protein
VFGIDVGGIFQVPMMLRVGNEERVMMQIYN